MANKFSRYLWIPFLLFAVQVVNMVLRIIWDSITSKYIGNPAVAAIEKFIENIDFAIIANLILNNPLQSSLVWFLITLSLILLAVYLETREPQEISLGNVILLTGSGTFRDSGFAIINNLHLENCKIFVSSIDGKPIERRYENDYLFWGENFYHNDKDRSIEIPAKEKGYLYINQIQSDIKRTNEVSFNGTHNIELKFHANTKTGKVIGLFDIFCTIEAGQMEFGGFTTERVLLKKVEI